MHVHASSENWFAGAQRGSRVRDSVREFAEKTRLLIIESTISSSSPTSFPLLVVSRQFSRATTALDRCDTFLNHRAFRRMFRPLSPRPRQTIKSDRNPSGILLMTHAEKQRWREAMRAGSRNTRVFLGGS